MWAIEIRGESGQWEECEEGPWDTRDEARAFGNAEVGAEWRVRRVSLHERCERIIRGWDQWSPAEQAKMDEAVAEIMEHVINGGGNRFVRAFCNEVLVPAIPGFVVS